MAGTNGKQKTARDMVLSLGVIVLAGLVMWVFIPHDDKEPDIKRVDYRVELLTARRAAPYPVAAPEGLAKEWKPTSVRYRGDDFDTWHLGFHTPDGEYVQVQQSTQKPARFIEDATQGAAKTERAEEIGGRTWTRYTGGRYDALVLQDVDGMKGATTVVAGTGSFEQLADMAAALKMD
ncbi:DUF4245 domain-containing protein [Streptomyces sp. TRM S81-3]|uniref:DUF4245 domain-containing protein n=1 Tax=Streptomyces griseicoloratus TaxID=2752516 RepID=A0A926L6I5_9ACTN|nr:DUF4245 domain-containing protein [Streptomyces griseicoloratus]MBD0422900.1 DUF4245 domain-containing protein [Streptomyces griseicoloratus]